MRRRSDATVMVYGATGWTGRLVARSLDARGLRVIVAGRSEPSLKALAAELSRAEAVHVRSTRAPDLAEVLGDVDVVVNCAGPSTELGLAVVDAAIAARVHYIDITGEESFVKRVYGSRDGAASAAGVIVAPAFAGKGALGDWAAHVAIDSMRGAANDARPHVAIAYAHTSEGFVRPSPGSALSAAGQGFIRTHDRRVAPLQRRFDFPPPFGEGGAIRVPGAEDISVTRHTTALEASTYVSIDPGRPLNDAWNRAIIGAYVLMPAIARALLSTPVREALSAMPSPVKGGAPSFASSIDVVSTRDRVTMGIAALDAYSVTSDIVTYGVECLLAAPRDVHGVLAPSQVVDAAVALEELQRRGAITVLSR